jgi:hypothetical protein
MSSFMVTIGTNHKANYQDEKSNQFFSFMYGLIFHWSILHC